MIVAQKRPREPDVKATAELLFGLEMKIDCPVCDARGCSQCDKGQVRLLPKDYQ